MQKTSFGRDFLLVVIGQIISLFGNAILRFALPLYLLRQTGSPALFGVVTACSFAPMVVLSMAGGVLADRVNKRNIMVGLDFSTAAIILTGILGSAFGPQLCRVLRLDHPAAQGAAFGTAAHVIGTSKAAELSQTAEAVSSLSLVVAGILTAVLCPLLF